MTRAVQGFTGLEHALEPIGEIHGVRFVNDSKATNVEAAERAIESFDRGLVVILGGRFKGGDPSRLRGPLAARGAIGRSSSARRDRCSTKRSADVVSVRDASSMDEAVRIAYTLAPPERHRAARPACASFDMFPDYAARVAGRSSRRSCGCRTRCAGSASSEQSSVRPGGEEPAAGNAGCPGLRGWCPSSSDGLMTADRSRTASSDELRVTSCLSLAVAGRGSW